VGQVTSVGLENRLLDLARQLAPSRAANLPFKVHKLKGDASSRAYYRLSNTGSASFVAMVLPQEGPQSEEVTAGPASEELPFVNVQRYLKSLGIPVPAILRDDLGSGILMLEDLGDLTLGAAIERGDDLELERLYGQAIDLLVEVQSRAAAHPDPSCLAFGRSFDYRLLRWEFDHYLEYGLVARTGRALLAPEQALLDQQGDRICRTLAASPRGFTHRDYQSRNLMVTDRGLVVIDFQDALLGPREYDLVALLRDSYVVLPEPFVDRMLDRYRARVQERTGELLDAARLRPTFDLTTVQRKLKDGGRFEFISRVKHNPSFLPFVAPSFRYVASALERLPEHAELLGLLRTLHPEMAAR
jgi:aminoglycoside/choline kinase family phosphotransferase